MRSLLMCLCFIMAGCASAAYNNAVQVDSVSKVLTSPNANAFCKSNDIARASSLSATSAADRAYAVSQDSNAQVNAQTYTDAASVSNQAYADAVGAVVSNSALSAVASNTANDAIASNSFVAGLASNSATDQAFATVQASNAVVSAGQAATTNPVYLAALTNVTISGGTITRSGRTMAITVTGGDGSNSVSAATVTGIVEALAYPVGNPSNFQDSVGVSNIVVTFSNQWGTGGGGGGTPTNGVYLILTNAPSGVVAATNPFPYQIAVTNVYLDPSHPGFDFTGTYTLGAQVGTNDCWYNSPYKMTRYAIYGAGETIMFTNNGTGDFPQHYTTIEFVGDSNCIVDAYVTATTNILSESYVTSAIPTMVITNWLVNGHVSGLTNTVVVTMEPDGQIRVDRPYSSGGGVGTESDPIWSAASGSVAYAASLGYLSRSNTLDHANLTGILGAGELHLSDSDTNKLANALTNASAFDVAGAAQAVSNSMTNATAKALTAVQPTDLVQGLKLGVLTNVDTSAVVVSDAGSSFMNGTYYYKTSTVFTNGIHTLWWAGIWRLMSNNVTAMYSGGASVTDSFSVTAGSAPAPTSAYYETYTTNTAQGTIISVAALQANSVQIGQTNATLSSSLTITGAANTATLHLNGNPAFGGASRYIQSTPAGLIIGPNPQFAGTMMGDSSGLEGYPKGAMPTNSPHHDLTGILGSGELHLSAGDTNKLAMALTNASAFDVAGAAQAVSNSMTNATAKALTAVQPTDVISNQVLSIVTTTDTNVLVVSGAGMPDCNGIFYQNGSTQFTNSSAFYFLLSATVWWIKSNSASCYVEDGAHMITGHYYKAVSGVNPGPDVVFQSTSTTNTAQGTIISVAALQANSVTNTDPRLNDARYPTQHPASLVTNLQATVAGYGYLTNIPAHSQPASSITNLQATVSGYGYVTLSESNRWWSTNQSIVASFVWTNAGSNFTTTNAGIITATVNTNSGSTVTGALTNNMASAVTISNTLTVASNVTVLGAATVRGQSDTPVLTLVSSASGTQTTPVFQGSNATSRTWSFSKDGNLNISGQMTNTGMHVDGSMDATGTVTAATLVGAGITNINTVLWPTYSITNQGTNTITLTNGCSWALTATGNVYLTSVALPSSGDGLINLTIYPSSNSVSWDTNVFNWAFAPTVTSNGTAMVLMKCHGSTQWTVNSPVNVINKTNYFDIGGVQNAGTNIYVGGMLIQSTP